MEEEKNYSQGFGNGNAYYSGEDIPYYTGDGTEGKTYSLSKGILGAGVGTLIGIALWCLSGLIGYVIPYIAAIMAFCAMIFYIKFAGDMDITGVVICGIFLLLGNYLGLHLCYAIFFYDWRPDMVTCITNLYGYLVQYDMIGSFIKNLGISYVCIFAGIFGFFRKMV